MRISDWSSDVCSSESHDTGHRERAIGIPTLLAFGIRDNAAHDALPFIGTKANHVRPRLEAARKHEMLHHPDFELLGAEARHRVGKIPFLADQGLEGLAVAAGAIIANDVKPIGRSYACTVIVGAFQPPNMDAPANAAFRSEEHTSELQS